MGKGLLHFLVPGQNAQRVLTVESTLYLPQLHRLLPNAELYAVTQYEEVPKLPQFSSLPVTWAVINQHEAGLPYAKGFFDLIVAENCLETSDDPLETATNLGVCLKDTGHLLTTFSNIRYWKILEELRSGHYRSWNRHLFAKPEIVRLLNDALYKEIVFSPFRQDAVIDPKLQCWLEAGFDNFSHDLITEVWMLKASRSTAEVAALKACYTTEIRQELAILLHRIEYDIERTDNLERLWRLCEQQMIFPAYLLGFIHETVVHEAQFVELLQKSAVANGQGAFVEELQTR